MSREQVLDNVRRRLGPTDTARTRLVNERLERHAPNTIPARASGTPEALVRTFTEMLERVQGSVAHVASRDGVPAAVAACLGGGEICLSPEVERMDLPWGRETSLTLVPWTPKTSFDACVTGCIGAAAETGTIAVTSSSVSPLTQHFLGETHIVLLQAQHLMGAYEELWQDARGAMPRHMTFVSGPSCTGDIEMIMEYGAHGPRRLHVIIIDENREG